MNHSLDDLTSARGFNEFSYRIVYLRPTPYSDERFAVGLVADASDRLETKFVSTPAAIDLMTLIFGEDGVGQFQFAAGECRRLAFRCRSIADFDVPTDLLTLGEPLTAYTCDRSGFLASVLASSSAFLRFDDKKISEKISNAEAALFSDEVLDHVNRLHPFLGGRIFHQQVCVSDEMIDLPICGQRIFGAPVSFAIRDQRMRAEAYVAKFNWVRNHIPQTPRMYVLEPSRTVAETSERLARSVRELQSIADAAKVDVEISPSTSALAEMIVRDEAA
jgi:hypothetical protein